MERFRIAQYGIIQMVALAYGILGSSTAAKAGRYVNGGDPNQLPSTILGWSVHLFHDYGIFLSLIIPGWAIFCAYHSTPLSRRNIGEETVVASGMALAILFSLSERFSFLLRSERLSLDMPLRRAPSLNLPNQLTVLRLGMCALLFISMSFPWPYAATTAFVIFTLASLTDWADGAIARARGLVTDLGKLLDPLADKVLVIGTLIALAVEHHHTAPMWMVVVIMTREFLISGLRQLAAAKQKILAADSFGKHKTLWQIIAVLVSLAYLSLSEFGLENILFARCLAASQIGIYWIALILTVVSGVIYFWKNSAIVQESMEQEILTGPPDAPLESIPAPAPSATAPTAAPPIATPAFKEWEAIVEALGHGAQIVILRKGGIAEGRAGFSAKHPKFWLFPTGFHQQWEKTKPALRQFVSPTAEPKTDVALTYFAEVTDAIYLSSWEHVARLDDAHFWGEEVVRERFDYKDRPGMEAGLHLLIVRVSRINLPHKLAPSKDYEGCKSWIDVPVDWEHDIATHVVRTEEFTTRRSRILAAVATVSLSSTTAALPKIETKLTTA